MALLLKDFTGFEKQGEGGMGEEYTATQVSLNRKVILKKIPQSLFQNQHYFERFERGAIFAASLDHENIVHIHDFGRYNETLYFAMEYIDGTDFEKVLSRKPFLREIGLMIVLQALKGLHFAHKRGMFHGDFKPANILI
jgi:serine/threonine protein kinase